VWQQKDVTDVASQGSIDGELYIYTNTAGMVHALNARNGETVWTYATGNKVFSAPFITSRLVVVTSCDGFVYALDKKDGSVRWI
jgi:outer membrane protein assembly factor BamB